jgi:hypothetical protein
LRYTPRNGSNLVQLNKDEQEQLRQYEAIQKEKERAAKELYDNQVRFAEQASDLIYNAMTGGWKRMLKQMEADAIKSGIASIITSVLSGGASFVGSGIFGSIGKLFGFAEGGYTANIGRSTVAGVVHGGEWVASANLVQNPQVAPIIAALQKMQGGGLSRSSFEAGGHVPIPTINNNINNKMQMVFDDGTIRAITVRQISSTNKLLADQGYV